jgi:hypothetical protein
METCALCPSLGSWSDYYGAPVCSSHSAGLARGRKVTVAQDRARPSVAEEAERLQARYEREAWKVLAARGVTPEVLRAGAKRAAEKHIARDIEMNRTGGYRCVGCKGPLSGLNGRRYCTRKSCKLSVNHPRYAEVAHPIRAAYAA